jgi:hypothetical protein
MLACLHGKRRKRGIGSLSEEAPKQGYHPGVKGSKSEEIIFFLRNKRNYCGLISTNPPIISKAIHQIQVRG